MLGVLVLAAVIIGLAVYATSGMDKLGGGGGGGGGVDRGTFIGHVDRCRGRCTWAHMTCGWGCWVEYIGDGVGS